MPAQYTVMKSVPVSYTPDRFAIYLLQEIDAAISNLEKLPEEAFKDWEWDTYLTNLTKRLNTLNKEYGECPISYILSLGEI